MRLMTKDEIKINDIAFLVSEGNQRAFDTFYNYYYQDAFHIAYYFVKDMDLCQDIIIESFFSIWKSRHSLKEIKCLDSYLYTIVKNQSLLFLAKECKRKVQTVSLSNIDMSMEVSDNNSADDHLKTEDLQMIINKIINSLPIRCKRIFLMSRNDMMDFSDIAKSLGISESTVRVQIKIAIDKILSQLKLLYPDLLISTALFIIFQYS